MTTTKELREALQSTEPAFTGFEVDGIRRQARRIRRRQRIAGAALGVSVLAGGAVVLPHIAEHARRDEADAAIADPAQISSAQGEGWSGSVGLFSADTRVAPKRGPLPKVTSQGRRIPVSTGTYVWVQPGVGGSSPGFCFGPATGWADSCEPAERDVNGAAAWMVLTHGYERTLVMLVDGTVEKIEGRVHGVEATDVFSNDLGFGYHALTLTLNDPLADAPVALAAKGQHGEILGRWTGVITSRNTATSVLAIPSVWPDRAKTVPLPGDASHVWVERRDGEKAPRFCVAPDLGEHSASCTPLTGNADGIAHAFGRTSDDGKRDIESIVTSKPVLSAAATLNGSSSPVSKCDLGSGYMLIVSVVATGGVRPKRLEMSGYDSEHREVVHFSVLAS